MTLQNQEFVNMFETLQELTAENERLKVCLTLAREIGQDWRNSWPNLLAGRTLRDQMKDLSKVADGEMTGKEYRSYWELSGCEKE